MIGDDVVDLDDEAIASHHLRARFLDRVLHPDERAALAAARSPKVLLWTFFAAKEAAYKVVARRDPSAIFAHRLYVVRADLCSVQYQDDVFALEVVLDVERGYVHAVARQEGAAPLRGVAELARPLDLQAPGLEARALLCRAVATRIGCAVDELAVVRPPRPGSWDGFGPPRLLRAGEPLPIDVSLSHDGRFVSFAAALA